MFVAWVNGLELLEMHRDHLENGQYTTAIFLLMGEYSQAALGSVVGLASELDAITGSSCLVIAFMPPPPEHDGSVLTRYKSGMLPKQGTEEWSAFCGAMTRASYEIAEYFGIPFECLPCLLIFSMDRGDEFALVELKKASLYDIYPDLRKIFSDWISEDKDEIEIQRARIAIAARPSRVNRDTSQNVRGIIAGVLANALPQIRAALLDAASSKKMRTRVAGVLASLRDNPFRTDALRQYLQRFGQTVSVQGVAISAENTTAAYDELYAKFAGRQYSALLTAALRPHRPFPLKRLKGVQKKIAFRQFGTVGDRFYKRGKAEIKDVLDIGSKVVGLISPP